MKNHFARLTYKLASYGIVAFGCVTVASSQNLSPIKPQSTPLPNPSLGSEIVEITVVINGAGRVNMPGLDCQAGPVEGNKICKRKVEKGKAVTAEAVPGDGLAFTSWAGACIGSNARCIFTPTKNVTIAPPLELNLKRSMQLWKLPFLPPVADASFPRHLPDLP